MLGFYLSTVVIWMIIIWCLMVVFKEELKKKIVKKEKKKKSLVKTLSVLFVLSAIPIMRLLVAIMIVYMATCSQEKFDELMNRNKQEDNYEQTV